jgi:hypothetical protein
MKGVFLDAHQSDPATAQASGCGGFGYGEDKADKTTARRTIRSSRFARHGVP